MPEDEVDKETDILEPKLLSICGRDDNRERLSGLYGGRVLCLAKPFGSAQHLWATRGPARRD